MITNHEYFYPSADATCPEECIQFATISERKLSQCQLAEDMLISWLGFEWASMYLGDAKLPSDGNPELMQGSQKLFIRALNLAAGTKYPTDFFDQENRREEYINSITKAKGYLQIVAKDMPSTFATLYHLGCYRKDPRWPRRHQELTL